MWLTVQISLTTKIDSDISQPSDTRAGACPSCGWGHAGRQGRRDAD